MSVCRLKLYIPNSAFSDDAAIPDQENLLGYLHRIQSKRMYLGHFYSGAPVRRTDHKNHLTTKCYPLVSHDAATVVW